MRFQRYSKYIVWVLTVGLSLWILYLIAGLGSAWVSVGIVVFVAFLVLFSRAITRRRQTTGQPSPKRRVVSNDIDRWGGGTSL